MNRRTRIVATLGPATDSPEVMRQVILAGVDVARINFSHGAAEEHLARIARFREVAADLNKIVAVLGDLPGPKLRVKITGAMQLEKGKEISFSMGDAPVAPEDIVLTEPEILRDVRPGHRILLDDGRLQLTAGEARDGRLFATITVGGTLLPKKGLNLPDSPLTIASLTDVDREALAVVAQTTVDWLALSFVRTPAAAGELRAEAAKHGLYLPVIAKVERPEALEQMEAIIKAFDGIMVARGDLGVEIPLEKVPTMQKRLIALARKAGKPVITATDMLDSMRQNPRPTRAESGDVANAIYDGTDAVMLSGETAVGLYPVEAVDCMHRIAVEAESNLRELGSGGANELPFAGDTIDDHVTQTIVELAEKIKAHAIVTPTMTGRTARQVARHRPEAMVVAAAPSKQIMQRMSIVWGVWAVPMDYARRTGDDRLSGAVRAAYEIGVLKPGMRVIVFAGSPVEGGKALPTIRILRLDDEGNQVSLNRDAATRESLES